MVVEVVVDSGGGGGGDFLLMYIEHILNEKTHIKVISIWIIELHFEIEEIFIRQFRTTTTN
ncbi:hypothetical protein DERP_003862 [Dermatophagoides pteronyssinus]|uniref:Uncharacterized protein n=1 Tax=Dermatophagoides pteronyssinus TaxID=6956 RepID=A0ABQ8J7G7_DERPT|nr:hypothetical protein DERP_003862 [Dermatophagoides pteronyssinus]